MAVPAILGDIFKMVGGFIGGGAQKKASRRAEQLQYDAAMKGVAESARQFDLTRADFASEQQLGEDAIGGFRGLVGLDGADEQQAAIMALRESPLYQSLYRNGEEATLANASATGGIRGGNTQRSLYELGEDTLSRVIQQQLGNYGGAIGIGTGADGAIGSFGANAVNAQAMLRNQGAGAQAQGALIRGGIDAQNWANVANVATKALRLIPGLKY
jgi:hypothetical protein